MRVDDSEPVRALVRALRATCDGLPAAEQYVMVHHPAFRVAKKPFVIAGMGHDRAGATLSINLGRDAQDDLLADARFARTPYIGQHGWVTIAHAALRPGELHALVTESYRRIANRKQLAALAQSPAAPTTKPRASAEERSPAKPRAPRTAATTTDAAEAKMARVGKAPASTAQRRPAKAAKPPGKTKPRAR